MPCQVQCTVHPAGTTLIEVRGGRCVGSEEEGSALLCGAGTRAQALETEAPGTLVLVDKSLSGSEPSWLICVPVMTMPSSLTEVR